MTQEEKDLLLQDLCTRLPYNVKVDITYSKEHGSSDRLRICSEGDLKLNTDLLELFIQEEIYLKPYLRSMSSMTEEEKEELNNYIFSEKGLRYFWFDDGIMYSGPDNQCFIGLGNDTIDKMIDWLNKHHFDYRELIEKGLALEAPEGMYN